MQRKVRRVLLHVKSALMQTLVTVLHHCHCICITRLLWQKYEVPQAAKVLHVVTDGICACK